MRSAPARRASRAADAQLKTQPPPWSQPFPLPAAARAASAAAVPASSAAAASAASAAAVSAASAVSPAPAAPLTVGRPIEPPLGCPRCRVGSLIWGRRAWGCSNFRACPLIIPYEFRGRRLGERDLRNLIERGESLPMLLWDQSSGAREVRARLRLSLSGQPDGFLTMVPAPAQ